MANVVFNGVAHKQIVGADGAVITNSYVSTADGSVYTIVRKIDALGGTELRRALCYARLDDDGKCKGIFEFPLEFDADQQTVSRSTKAGNGLEKDLYIEKRRMLADGRMVPVFRYAVEADVIHVHAQAKKNAAMYAQDVAKKAPEARDERVANMIADGIAAAISKIAPQMSPKPGGQR